MSGEKGFKKAFVIFMDILGSQNRSDFNELFEINELFHSELLANKHQDREYVAYQRHIYTFSDCAYIIYDHKNESDSNWSALFNVALLNCEPLLMKFLSKGLVLRGGAAYGDVYYDENKNMFFGDAINKAYQYESKTAKYPRIVIDDYVAKKVIKYTKRVDKRFEKRNKKIDLTFDDHIGCIVDLDSDRKYYLNYFNSIQHGRDYSLIIKKNNKQFLEDVISMCDERIALFEENENVRSKYEWLKKYADRSVNEHINKVIEYKKPFWDKVFAGLNPQNRTLFNKYYKYEYLTNVGRPFDIQKQFERFNNFKTLNYLWQSEEKDGMVIMTNEQKIREKISTIEGLADYLVSYNNSRGEFYTSDCERFETKDEAVQHEINWLKEEYNEL